MAYKCGICGEVNYSFLASWGHHIKYHFMRHKGGYEQEEMETEEKKEIGLKEEMKNISEKLDELTANGKVRKVRVPKLSRGKLKNNWAVVCFINENKEVTFFKKQIEEGTIMHKDTPYLATANYMLTHKKQPMLIIPAWSVEPFSPQKSIEDAERDKSLSIGYRYLYNRMKNALITQKKSISTIAIIGGIVVIIGLIFLATGGMPKDFKLF